MGLYQAGFEDITGVDIEPQPRYCGDKFIQADALEYVKQHGHEFDLIFASPPCQGYSRVSGRARKGKCKAYPMLIPKVRELLIATGLPYVIENVEGAPLGNNTFMLCGSMFGLDVRRHRLFESNMLIIAPSCQHYLQLPRFRTLNSRRKGKLACVVGVHGHLNYAGEFELRKQAMGIDWMTNEELTQAIPPAYTKFIGLQLLRANK